MAEAGPSSERKGKCLNARIQELYLEGPVHDRAGSAHTLV
jgi:hypothetical protein